VFDKALAKEPGKRYATCREFVTALLKTCDSCPDWVPLGSQGACRLGLDPRPDFEADGASRRAGTAASAFPSGWGSASSAGIQAAAAS